MTTEHTRKWGCEELVPVPASWPKVSEDTPCRALPLYSSEVTLDPEDSLDSSGMDGSRHTASDPVPGVPVAHS